jgi:hypothetical protein
MFVEMVGSTGLSETIGADSMHELLKRFQVACWTQAVIDHDGLVSTECAESGLAGLAFGRALVARFGGPAGSIETNHTLLHQRQ